MKKSFSYVSVLRTAAFAAAVFICRTAFCQNEVCTITVNPANAVSTNNSKWQGWGTSLCWWANRIGYNETLTRQAARLFFDPKEGLGLNIMRYNAGGGDDPLHNHITRTDSDVPGWTVKDPVTGAVSWDYKADARQLEVLKAAYKAAGQDVQLEVFSNSPPYYMTNSGCSTGSFISTENNLKDGCYMEFAQYLARVSDYIQNTMGMKVASVSPMNEPNTNYWPAMSYKQEGCHFDAGESQSRIILETARALKELNLDNVLVAASDETNPGKQVEEIEMLSPAALQALGRINVHSYATNGIREMGRLAKDVDRNMWMSEVDGKGTLGGPAAGEMQAALWFADKIIYDIEQLEPSGWVTWQVIDTHVSKEGYKGRTDTGPLNRDGGYWGTAWADHDAGTIELTQKYYAFGQFSRYIRPGSTIILCNPGAGSAVRAVAAVQGRSVTVVAVNVTDSAKPVKIDLSAMDLKRRVKCKAYRTSGSISNGEHWTPVQAPAVDSRCLETVLSPFSITTFLIR